MRPLSSPLRALTFDLFGTILDLGGSLKPELTRFLAARAPSLDADRFWAQWRARQRIEQYQDTMLMLGHSGCLETVRRALIYILRLNGLATTSQDVTDLMAAWQGLQPFGDALPTLDRLGKRYRLVVVSNGDPDFLMHLATNQVRWTFDAIFSATSVGALFACRARIVLAAQGPDTCRSLVALRPGPASI